MVRHLFIHSWLGDDLLVPTGGVKDFSSDVGRQRVVFLRGEQLQQGLLLLAAQVGFVTLGECQHGLVPKNRHLSRVHLKPLSHKTNRKNDFKNREISSQNDENP